MTRVERATWQKCAVYLRAEAARYGPMPACALRHAADECEQEARLGDGGPVTRWRLQVAGREMEEA